MFVVLSEDIFFDEPAIRCLKCDKLIPRRFYRDHSLKHQLETLQVVKKRLCVNDFKDFDVDLTHFYCNDCDQYILKLRYEQHFEYHVRKLADKIIEEIEG